MLLHLLQTTCKKKGLIFDCMRQILINIAAISSLIIYPISFGVLNPWKGTCVVVCKEESKETLCSFCWGDILCFCRNNLVFTVLKPKVSS